MLNFQYIYQRKNDDGLRMISEGSCDTEHWSNDAQNVVLSSQE